MEDIILLSHGSGGESTRKLIEEEILKYFGNELLNELYDSSIFEASGKLAFTTDSFVISPLFFNGGDIGKLSIYGTVNDLSVMGAKPLYLSVGFIIEEGLTFNEFRQILQSMKSASKECMVKIITGDTKVVEKGKGDKIFINTTGIGIIEEGMDWRGRKIEEGDVVIINGGIGEHGLCIMLQRLGIKTDAEVKSDLAPLNSLTLPLLKISNNIKFMRDPTRGGVAGVLNEIAQKHNVEIEVEEENLPIKPWVKSASEILGIDPLYSANEGKVVIIASEKDQDKIMNFLKNHPQGKEARIIGKIKGKGSRVYLKTRLGTRRILDPLKRDLLPRIC
ncbi:hydrogenase expression/formation protein HypE [Dictyoglomus thermophilum]|uniref:Hydrogenase expression/formation protein HypE n=1 Tax=Dictyoglomus thermophilum (strain ATCC 35947 / DSM 3960 / H-6-12) TaxID=309799 RepID=B5YB76_DICT6|nr:hydrogenase expression/formation protein HypE [Dictyoglomus thermophilum]ACI19926.1 hydrogenase expression/formation protein HypE [Dictyoglomus thermophilum H-6-12]